SPILQWAAEEDLIEVNLVPSIRKSPEKKRARVLTRDEIATVWKACDKLDKRGPSSKAYARIVRFLLVTAQRRDEVASLKHGDVIDGRWKQTDNKSGRAHTLRLPPLALELIGKGTAHELAFAGKSGKIIGFSKLKAELDKQAKVTGWRLHDLRRTAATNM